MNLWFWFFIGVLGLILGSFLNVFLLRHHTGRGLSGRSACLSCSETLSWYELIPVFSYLLQCGRCTHCHAKLSILYPLVEFASTGLLLGLFLWFGLPYSLTESVWLSAVAVLLLSLLGIFAYDVRHHIVPNALVYPFITLSFALLFLDPLIGLRVPLYGELAAGPLVALPLFFFWLLSRGRWMGLGDAKLALGMGWFLGIIGGIAALLVAFWLGAIIALLLLGLSYTAKRLWHLPKALTMKSEVPFAPFLIVATLLVFFFDFDVLLFFAIFG